MEKKITKEFTFEALGFTAGGDGDASLSVIVFGGVG